MRNLKRALSLALASVMVVSMMVVGAGAASYDEFSDKDEIVNKEAVQMLVELGVINGKDDGTYDPTGIVTRAEMAKMICVVLNGGKDPSLGSTVTNTYTDTVGHWASGYIEYCTQLGIVAGDGTGKFNPNATVTGSEAAKMLLVAMGYKSEVEGFTGANWAIAVNVRANQKGLYSDLSISVDEGLSRDNAAQMIYNALDAGIVSYEYTLVTDGSSISSSPTLIDNNEKTLLENAFNAVKVEGVVVANEYANLAATSDKGSALDAGETKLNVTNYGTDEDQNVFGSGTYSVSTSLDMLGKSVTLYVKKDASSTSKATILGNAILSDDNVVVTSAAKKLISKVASDNDLDVTDAKVITNYTKAVDYADYADTDANKTRGVEKVLIDNNDDGDVDYVLVNTWYFGQVSKYSTKDDGSITIDINKAWTEDDAAANLTADDADDVVGFEDVAEDDYVLAAWIGGKLYVEQAESVTGTLEAIKAGETMTVDGTKYDVSEVKAYKAGDDEIQLASEVGNTYLDNEGTFYLDKNGMIVAVGNVAENAYDFAYVWVYDNTDPIDDARVKVTLSDGTTKTYTVDKILDKNGKDITSKSDIEGHIFSYNINSSDEIKLTATTTDASFSASSFTKGSTKVGTGTGSKNIYATNNTVFFYVTENESGKVTDVDVYTGYKSAPSLSSGIDSETVALNNSGSATAVAYVGTKLNTTAAVADHLYVTDVVSETSDYTTVKAILAGTDEEVEIKVEDGLVDDAETGLYLYSVDGDLYTLDTKLTTDGAANNQYQTVGDVADHVSDSTLAVTDGEYTLTDKTVLIELDDGDFDTAYTGRLPASDDKIVAILVDDADDGDLLMVIVDNATEEDDTVEASKDVKVLVDNNTIYVYNPESKADSVVAASIVAQLKADGYTDAKYTLKNGTYTFSWSDDTIQVTMDETKDLFAVITGEGVTAEYTLAEGGKQTIAAKKVAYIPDGTGVTVKANTGYVASTAATNGVYADATASEGTVSITADTTLTAVIKISKSTDIASIVTKADSEDAADKYVVSGTVLTITSNASVDDKQIQVSTNGTDWTNLGEVASSGSAVSVDHTPTASVTYKCDTPAVKA